MRTLKIILSLLILGFASANISTVFAANNQITDWQKSPYSQARLHILSTDDEWINLAIEINLEDKYKTYWLAPGTTGVPANITISGINIVDNSEILKYPMPNRYINKYGETWGYKNKTVLYSNVKRINPQNESTLNIDFGYATCDVICLPVQVSFQMRLQAGDVSKTVSSMKFYMYENKIPKTVKLSESKLKTAVLTKQGKLNLRFNDVMKNDIFVTDSKNRFYQNLSKDSELYQYSLFGLSTNEQYFKSPINVFYQDGFANYQTEILVTRQ